MLHVRTTRGKGGDGRGTESLPHESRPIRIDPGCDVEENLALALEIIRIPGVIAKPVADSTIKNTVLIQGSHVSCCSEVPESAQVYGIMRDCTTYAKYI
jgi:hypothetical protein